MEFKMNDWSKLDELREVYFQKDTTNKFHIQLCLWDTQDRTKKYQDAEYIYSLLCDGIKFRELKMARRIDKEIELEVEKSFVEEDNPMESK